MKNPSQHSTTIGPLGKAFLGLLAALIIAERERGGPFSYPEDLLSVRGIGAKKLESIREMLDLTGGIEPD